MGNSCKGIATYHACNTKMAMVHKKNFSRTFSIHQALGISTESLFCKESSKPKRRQNWQKTDSNNVGLDPKNLSKLVKDGRLWKISK
jgi:hypothetical protein